MEVQSQADRIDIRLKAKPSEQFDDAQIGACLDYTVGQVDSSG